MAPKPPCGNPLFLEWLTEIYESLRSSDARSTQTYKKACDALQSCPIKYVRPAELIHLRGIGPGIVKQLEKKQKEYYEREGLEVPEAPLPSVVTSRARQSGVKRKQSRTRADSSGPDNSTDNSDLGDFSVDIEPGSSIMVGPTPKRLKSTITNTNKSKTIKSVTSKSTTAAAAATKKMYIPKIRSGAFAILIALLLRLPLESQRIPLHPDEGGLEDVVDLKYGWMSKSELVAEAQEYCDVSMNQSENGGHHTGYSAMSGLTQKGLVHREGNPARFRLTELGLDTARAIRHLAEIEPLQPVAGPSRLLASVPHQRVSNQIGTAFPMGSPPSRSGNEPVASRLGVNGVGGRYQRQMDEDREDGFVRIQDMSLAGGRKLVGTSDGVVRSAMRHGESGGRDKDEFVFWYIGALDKRVSNLELATCTMHYELQVPVRKVEFPARLVSHPEATQIVNVKRKTEWVMVGWVLEFDAQPTCPGFDDEAEVSESPHLANRQSPSVSPPGEGLDIQGRADHEVAQRCALSGAVNVAGVLRLTSYSSQVVTGPTQTTAAPSVVTPKDKPIAPASADNERTHPAPKPPRLASHSVAPIADLEVGPMEVTRTNSTGHPNFDIQSAIKFPPGSYEIILIMDCRELHKKRDVDEMTKGLLDKGVKVEVRALKMGDITWIARDTTGKQAGEEKEVVLDFVVERKRLDDLVGSIKDGRYDDQKLRLTNSCIRNVYYVIEDWDNQRNRSEYGQQIATSKSQTQVIDQCFVKDTHTLKETISFLKTMSDAIQELYQHETLYLIPSRYISRPTYVELQRDLRSSYPTKYFITSYETYQAINSKSGNCTLLETFARMLMCIRGMTHEKLCLVLDVWQTPLEMWQAVKRREAEIIVELERERAMGPIRGKSKVRPIELFFADAIEGRSQRQKIGDALSREIYAVICA